ncbi:MAG: hypothetical protein PHT91_03350, partial [Candidatus Nanoarchaeia archaeon]|nr:hypothetical protein [Candidatus Nanoarchaeia archaeon]
MKKAIILAFLLFAISAAHAHDTNQTLCEDDGFTWLDGFKIPIAHWRFDEGNGSTAFDGAGANHGAINGASWTNGSYRSALQFDDGKYVSLPNDVGYTNQFSAFAWFKSQGIPKGNYHVILGGQELEISIPYPSGELRTGVYTSNGRFEDNHGSGLLDGDWHFIGFTFNGTTKRNYIDGIHVGDDNGITGTLTNSFSNRVVGRWGSST